MLKLVDESSADSFFEQQKQAFSTYSKRNEDFYEDVLKPAIQRGDWDELESIPLFFDENNKPVINFKDDAWALKDIFGKELFDSNIYFTIEENKNDNLLGLGKKLERTLCNQIKCIALVELFFFHKPTSARLIADAIRRLCYLAVVMLDNNSNDLGDISMSLLRELVSVGVKIRTGQEISTLNKVVSYGEFLPFKMQVDSQITAQKLNVAEKESEGKTVIPCRIYHSLLAGNSEVIEKLYRHRDEIEAAVRLKFQGYAAARKLVIERLRTGSAKITSYMGERTANQFVKALTDNGIELVDNFKDERWIDVWNDFDISLTSINYILNQHIKGHHIGGKEFTKVSQLNDYLEDLDIRCKYLVLALSGMRVDELRRMSPIYGAQSITIKNQTIYLFTTRQSKVSLNTQTKNDVFVTTKTGFMAYEILKAIHKPMQEKFKGSDKGLMFSQVNKVSVPQPIEIDRLRSGIADWVNKHSSVDVTLTEEDIKNLKVSDPTRLDFKVGAKYRFTCHQLRRSLAYYLIGYELLSFPQLKQQFGHYSMAMTRWYARNASSFQKMYSEIQEERVEQQSEIMKRIYNKIANKERLAGGKGKDLTKLGKNNYFEEAEEQRKLSKAYWEAEIKENRTHIHAIAPGMWCTRSECGMRMNIDLSECVDCGFDIVEDAAYLETSRMDAMKNIIWAEEEGVLNPSLASKYIVQIKSAEAMMDDLGFDYEPFVIPDIAKNMLIKSKMEV
ncbi:tyrosine-type recombinase/integrase [Vibrio parahaemolyticus]